MSRNALPGLGFLAIVAVAGLIAYRVAEPRQLVTEADNRDLLAGMATGIAAQSTALIPTVTPYLSPTPTRTPKPPTPTPLPTYGPKASPGIWMVPRWTEVPVATEITDAGLPDCADVTPSPYEDTTCEAGP